MYTGSLPSVSNREHWDLSITVTDITTGTAIDLTGAVIDVAVRDQLALSQPVMTFQSGDGFVTIETPATNGIFDILVPPSTMQQLPAGHYDVGIRITLASGRKRQLIQAVLVVVDGIVIP